MGKKMVSRDMVNLWIVFDHENWVNWCGGQAFPMKGHFRAWKTHFSDSDKFSMKTLEYTDLDGSLGWQVVPKIGFEQSKEATPCGTFVRQNGIAPRWIIRSTSNNKKGICKEPI